MTASRGTAWQWVVFLVAAGCCLPAAGQAVSFTKDVAPMLVARCGGCHVAGRKGKFHMPTYAGLMQTGMVQRGKGNASRLVEVILSGDMPRGGGTVTPDEVGRLMKWIDAGAVFDGPDPALPLDQLRPPAPPPAATATAVKLEAGAVSFAIDVAPVLLQECVACHGPTDPEANLQITSLETLLRGGRSGTPVLPGKGAASLLVRKLRGREIEGQRMPLGKNPLADDVIARIERWIDEGARLDMLAANTPLETVAAAGRARSMSDADLQRLRLKAGQKLWKRAIPDEEPVVEVNAEIGFVGNLPAGRMRQLAETAAPLVEPVRQELVGPAGPLLRGGVMIYVFRQSYDYSAFWQNIVGAERPKGLMGHAAVSGDVAYGAMLVPNGDDAAEDTKLLLAAQIAGAALAGRNVPGWFAVGAGRAVAMKVLPKAPLVQEWKREAPASIAGIGSVADFMTGRSDPAATAAAAGGFVATLTTGNRLRQLVAAIDGGAAFDAAFIKVFRAAPQLVFEDWAVKAARRAPRSKPR